MKDYKKVILVAQVGIKDLNLAKANDYLCSVENYIQNKFDETVKVIVVPNKDSRNVDVLGVNNIKKLSQEKIDELSNLVKEEIELMRKEKEKKTTLSSLLNAPITTRNSF